MASDLKTLEGDTARAVIRRRRPRALTLVVLFVVAALIVLANLSFEPKFDWGLRIGAKSFGWPLIWRRCVLVSTGISSETVGWYYSVTRLAEDLAIWLLLLAASGGVCEWLPRRYTPRPHWSLRTMLVGMGIAAVFCAWFAAARDRANLRDPLFAAMGNSIRVTRSGPRWLDLIGADRFRRHIISAQVNNDYQELETIVPALGRSDRLRYLELSVEHLHPRMADALANKPQLRSLSIWLHGASNDDDRRVCHECLVAIGQMKQLEKLILFNITISSESLTHLAGLTNLERLELRSLANIHGEAVKGPVLAHLPPLPRVEFLNLERSRIHDLDLPYITALPRLRSLVLDATYITDAASRQLARMASLEHIELPRHAVSRRALESLAALKCLRVLQIGHDDVPGTETVTLDHGGIVYVRASELDRFQRALLTLRQSRPGIVIEKGPVSGTSPQPEDAMTKEEMTDWINDKLDDHRPFWLPTSDAPSMTPAAKARFDAAGGWARFDAAGLKLYNKTVSF